MKFIRKITKKEDQTLNSKEAAKERLHLVLLQDRANVSADFLELMKQEIIDVIKKYIDVDEKAIDVRLTNKDNGDGTKGAPALYANIPIINIKDEVRQNSQTNTQGIPHDTQENTANTEENDNETDKPEENTNNEETQQQESREEVKESEVDIHEDQVEQSEKVIAQNVEN